ncbi:MAG: AAA domain-containing protein, partial [Ktedonobacteraceae bacterium]
VTYIIGPPGTGKTLTLAAIAFAHLREGRTVLIAAHTNIAVDNAIMRLAEMCKDAGAIHELKDGRVIRYGTAQLEERLKNEYSEVHLKTIVEQRLGNLKQQREGLQEYLDRVSAKLSLLTEEKTRKVKHWQNEREHLITQRDTCKSELGQLETAERQRIAALDAQLRNLSHQIAQLQQQGGVINQKLTWLTEQQVQQQTLRSQLLVQINGLTARLAEAQQMNPVVRFFKRIDPEKLAQYLNDRQQQMWRLDQRLAELLSQINEMRNVYAACERQFAHLTNLQSDIALQRNTPSIEMKRIEQLRVATAECDQDIAQLDAQSDIEQDCYELKNEVDRIKEQIAAIDRQKGDTDKSIVAGARVIATTLCKTYMNSTVRERRFDVVILDEVSMAPLPAVFVAASRADSSTVMIGDPRQLAPICTAETPLARKWLGTDLFDFRTITLEGAGGSNSSSTLLEEQARMHPHISHIARQHVYQGRIRDKQTDAHEHYAKVRPLAGKALLLCDTRDAAPLAMRPEGGSRINVYSALCTMEIARQALDSLPEREIKSGEFRIGIVTPYRKQAELLQQMIKDAHLQKTMRAGTVHRFQGLEAEVIIFDTVDSPPLSPSPLTSGSQGSDAMRLINVAVTRAKHKLIIVANSQYIQAQLSPNDTLRLAVKEAQEKGCTNSRDVFSVPLLPLRTSSRKALPDRKHEILNSGYLTYVDQDTYEIEPLDDRTFYDQFLDDMTTAKRRAIIFSPFLSPERVKQLVSIFSERQKAGVHITAFTAVPTNNDSRYSEAANLLKKAGVEVRIMSGMHEKLVIIDEAIVYAGSLNVLSHIGTTEFMGRGKSPSFAKKIMQFKNVDALLKAPTHWGSAIEVSLHELPSMNCKKCGKAMTVKNGRYGPFYGCTSYPACTYTEDIGEQHLNSIAWLVNTSCRNCSGQMAVKTNRKDAWLVCGAPISCGFGHQIAYTRSG